MCDFDAEEPACCRETFRKARKEHNCCACKEPIAKGHKYYYTSGVYEGRPFSYRHCLRCATMLDAIAGKSDGQGVDIELSCGTSWEAAFEEAPPDWVTELAFMTPAEAQVALAPYDFKNGRMRQET